MLRKFQIQHIFYKKSLKVLDDTGESLHLQHQYSKSLSRAENFNFLPKTANNLFKFSAQDSDLEYLRWRCKIFPVSPDLKPPLVQSFAFIFLSNPF